MTRYENYRRFRETGAVCRHCMNRAAAFGKKGLCLSCYDNRSIRRIYPRASPADKQPTEAELEALIAERMQQLPPRWWGAESWRMGELALPSAAYRACEYVLERYPDAMWKMSLIQAIAGERYAIWSGTEQLSKWCSDVGEAWRAAGNRLGGTFKDDTKPSSEPKRAVLVIRSRRK